MRQEEPSNANTPPKSNISNRRNQQVSSSQYSNYNSSGANSSMYVKSDDAPRQLQDEEGKDLDYFDIEVGASARVSALHMDVGDLSLIPTRESSYDLDPKPISWNVRKSNVRKPNKKVAPVRSRQSNLTPMAEIEEDDDAISDNIERKLSFSKPLHTKSDSKTTAPLGSSPSSNSKNSRTFEQPAQPQPNRKFGVVVTILSLAAVGLVLWLLNEQGKISLWKTESSRSLDGSSPSIISLAMPAKATFIEEFGSSIAEYLENPDSPQFQAAKWIDEVDTMFQLPLAAGDSRAFRQRFALATFYFAMGGDGYWYEDYSFLSPTHECNWKIGSSGVQCDSSRNVIGITMILNGLRGSLPPEIGLGLETLQNIKLDGNQITGSIPEEIYTLTDLRSLSIPFNKLSGSISPSIGNLQELTSLSLTQGSLDGTLPYEMNFMTNLEIVELSQNLFTGRIPDEISYFPSLRKLDVSSNNISGRIPEGSYVVMEEFIVDTNQLTGNFPRSILQPNLKKLSLHNNRLSGDLPTNDEWGAATSLESIIISDNDFQGTIPLSIGSMRNLNTFVARNVGLSGRLPRELENTALEVLNVEGNSLSGNVPQSYGNLPLGTWD